MIRILLPVTLALVVLAVDDQVRKRSRAAACLDDDYEGKCARQKLLHVTPETQSDDVMQLLPSVLAHLQHLLEVGSATFAVDLIQLPKISQLLRSSPQSLVQLLNHAIQLDRVQFVTFLLGQPYIGDLINGVPDQALPISVASGRINDLMNGAPRQALPVTVASTGNDKGTMPKEFIKRRAKDIMQTNAQVIMRRMLKVSDLDLSRTDPISNQAAFSSFPLQPDLIQVLFEQLSSDRLLAVIRNDPSHFIRCLLCLTSDHHFALFQDLIQLPFMHEFIIIPIMEDGSTMLSSLLSKRKFKHVDLIMSIPGIQIRKDPSMKLVPSSEAAILLMIDEVSVPNLMALLRSQRIILCDWLQAIDQAFGRGTLLTVLQTEKMKSIVLDPKSDLLHFAFDSNLDLALILLGAFPDLNVTIRDGIGCVPFYYCPADLISIQTLRDNLPEQKVNELIASDRDGFIEKLLYRADADDDSPDQADALKSLLEMHRNQPPSEFIALIQNACRLDLKNAADDLISEVFLAEENKYQRIGGFVQLANLARSMGAELAASRILNCAECRLTLRGISYEMFSQKVHYDAWRKQD